MTSRLQHFLAVGAVVLTAAYFFAAGAPTANDKHSQPPLRAIGAIMPRLSEAGDQIAFSYQGAIWRMPRDGGTMTRLTHGDLFDIEPAWSPDGKTIAYIKSRDFGTGTLQVIHAD